jgi:hypothetical protein
MKIKLGKYLLELKRSETSGEDKLSGSIDGNSLTDIDKAGQKISKNPEDIDKALPKIRQIFPNLPKMPVKIRQLLINLCRAQAMLIPAQVLMPGILIQ